MISFCVVQGYMYTCYSPIQYTIVPIFVPMYVLVRTPALTVGYDKPPPNILSIPCIPYNTYRTSGCTSEKRYLL